MINELESKIWLFLYRASFFRPFSKVGELASKPLVKPIFLNHSRMTNRMKPFYIIITIDSEAGYVDDTEQRLWQLNYPNLFQGFYFGIRNWLSLLDRYRIKASFLLSTQCFSAKKKEKSLIEKQIYNLILNNHELGYHLHPRSDRSLERILGEKLKFTSSKFYSPQKIDKILQAARRLFQGYLGKKVNQQIKSFRWGNFGLFEHAIKPLENNGFLIDSSVCPKLTKHQNDDMICDWSKISQPFPFIFKKSRILEIPVTTFTFLNKVLVVEPIYHIWLYHIFNSYRVLSSNNEKPFFFVIHSHSSESTYKNGNPTKIITVMANFIEKMKKITNVSFITLSDAYKIINRYEKMD